MTKKGLKASFLDSLKKEYKWNLFDNIWSCQGVSGINPQGFLPRYGNEANFSCFFHFSNFEV